MNFEVFKEELKNDINKVLADDSEAIIKHVETPEKSYDALAVKIVGYGAGIAISLQDLYKEYEDNGYHEVLETTKDAIRESLDNAREIGKKSEFLRFLDYERIKDRLFIELVPTEKKESVSAECSSH